MDRVFFVLAIIGGLVFILTVLVGFVANIIQATSAWLTIPPHLQRSLLIVIAVCVILIIPYGYTSLTSTPKPDPPYPTPSNTSAISNSPTPTTTQASPLIMIPLTIQQPSGQNLSAVLYFGQVGVLRKNHPDVGFVLNEYAQQHEQLCVETVVVSSISGKTAVVYSQGLPTSWGAAEGIPQSDMTQTNYIAHQQLIVPPASTGPGTSYDGGAQVVIDQNIKAVTEKYRLTLKTITSPQTQWNVQNSNGTDFGTVECTAGSN